MCHSFTSRENLHAGIVCSALRKIALGMLSTSAALISGRGKTEAQRQEQMIARCRIADRDHTADLTRAIDRTTAANSIKPATRLVPPDHSANFRTELQGSIQLAAKLDPALPVKRACAELDRSKSPFVAAANRFETRGILRRSGISEKSSCNFHYVRKEGILTSGGRDVAHRQTEQN